ncbi:MAG: hypothetical protein K0S74_967 [Chlamydiales bacterium]|jgi:hypothetical protein|nr:hypothetical protein [Chlamydiales bacterium]
MLTTSFHQLNLYSDYFNNSKADLEPLLKNLFHFLETKIVDEDLLESLFTDFHSKLHPHWYQEVDTLQNFLIISYLSSQASESFKKNHLQLKCCLERTITYFGQINDQYRQALLALNFAINSLPIPILVPQQSLSGATFLQSISNWLDRSVLAPGLQAELNILWFILYNHTSDETLIQGVLKSSQWLLSSLDHKYYPLHSLYTKEPEAFLACYTHGFTLLFSILTQVKTNSTSEQIQKISLERLTSHLKGKVAPLEIAYYTLLTYIVTQFPITKLAADTTLEILNSFCPTENICDTELMLAGFSNPKLDIRTTLSGYNSGLGTILFGELGIINYGPQIFPLGKSTHFGIQASPERLKEQAKLFVKPESEEFFLSGKIPFLSSPSDHILGSIKTGLWLNIEQTFRHQELRIKASFVGYKNLDKVYFVFYVKADKAKISSISLAPRSLDRYQSPYSESIIFSKGNQSFKLCLNNLDNSEMQVIPLAGNKAFWGGDFLVAYALHPYPKSYIWNICSI